MNDKGILDGHKVVPIKNLIEWAQKFETMNRRVAETFVGRIRYAVMGGPRPVRVSTVFLGIDHGFGGKPMWFETMVFGGKLNQEQDRYETWDKAVAGHKAMVKRVSRVWAKKGAR